MGRDNNNAGIHLVPDHYKYKSDIIEKKDKYACIIAEERLKDYKSDSPSYSNIIKKRNAFLQNVSNCNFVKIMEDKYSVISCKCGSKTIHYREDLNLKFRHNGEMVIITSKGKKCMECGRVYVLQDDLTKWAKNNGYL